MADSQCDSMTMRRMADLAYALVFPRRQTMPNSEGHHQVVIAAQLYPLVLLSDYAHSLVNLWPVAVQSTA